MKADILFALACFLFYSWLFYNTVIHSSSETFASTSVSKEVKGTRKHIWVFGSVCWRNYDSYIVKSQDILIFTSSRYFPFYTRSCAAKIWFVSFAVNKTRIESKFDLFDCSSLSMNECFLCERYMCWALGHWALTSKAIRDLAMSLSQHSSEQKNGFFFVYYYLSYFLRFSFLPGGRMLQNW